MEDEQNTPTLISITTLNPEYSHLQQIRVTSNQFSLGRRTGKSAVISFLSISRLHCIFTKLENNDWYIKDFSRFGIKVNNKIVGKGFQVILRHGDIIMLEPSHHFIYQFCHPSGDMLEVPKKRIKIEENTPSCSSSNTKMKFEESQNAEKIKNTKYQTSILLKQQPQEEMDKKIQLLKKDFAKQIEKLKSEKNEVERQKALLIEERDSQLAQVKNEMEGKIAELMEQIQKHKLTESELLKENNLLKEKLDKGKEDILAELSQASSSKKDILDKLEAETQEQEEIQQKEKQTPEDTKEET